MKYKEKYPNAECMDMVENDILVGGECSCVVCKELTKFIEVCSETHMCSDECKKKWYKDYFEMLRNSPDEEIHLMKKFN